MQPGELVSGRFEIQELAGSGGMGAVYRALDRQTGGLVAVKVLHGHGADHAERFAREARLLSELHHPGIVRFIANGTTPAREGFLAMEWLDGESLSARLARGPMPLDEALVIASRVAEALGVAHERGIVHRDLKPGNLFLVQGEAARVMVLDFGIARVLEAGQTLTITGAMLGTPGYMSPEQSRGDKDVDARADVFALGCVLFKCLTGRPVFGGEDALSVSLKVLIEPAPRVATLLEDVPPALDDLIDRMLAKRREERPPTTAALLAELSAITAGSAPSLPPASIASSAMGRPSAVPARAPSIAPRAPSVVPGPPSQPATAPPPLLLLLRGQPLLLAGIAGGPLVLVLVVVLLLVAVGGDSPRSGDQGSGPTSANCPGEKCASIRTADLSHVDATDLLAQARQLALSVDRTAELLMINAATGSGDGTVDLGNPTHALNYHFQGKGGALLVHHWASKLVVSHYGGRTGKAIGETLCSAKAAWKTAVAHGAPRGGAVQINLLDAGPQLGVIWMVAGGSGVIYLDGHTCAFKR